MLLSCGCMWFNTTEERLCGSQVPLRVKPLHNNRIFHPDADGEHLKQLYVFTARRIHSGATNKPGCSPAVGAKSGFMWVSCQFVSLKWRCPDMPAIVGKSSVYSGFLWLLPPVFSLQRQWQYKQVRLRENNEWGALLSIIINNFVDDARLYNSKWE